MEDFSINISVKTLNIPNDSAEIVNFHFSHYKSLETISCHSNQSSYPTGIKNITFRSPYLKMLCVEYGKNPPEMSFENVDRRPTDGQRMPVYTISSPMSLRTRNSSSGFPTSCRLEVGNFGYRKNMDCTTSEAKMKPIGAFVLAYTANSRFTQTTAHT